ncbi:MAG: TonB-dependent receptor [Ignavibacteria bacterium]|nr:TonB-dependent receptor [Ignavibacteria bacterium]
MFRKLLLVLAAMLILPALLFAQDGKLRGKVTDRESGEALIGANITIEGTNLGAATDVNGEFVILSVPPGIYTVKATYIGYSPVTISNITVNASLTTNADVKMASSAVQVQGVEIVAERPLIQRNTTNTIRIQSQADVQVLPFRGVQNIVAISAGVVQQAGNLYVRGGREGEVAYYVDGANVTDPTSMGEMVSLIREALQEVQLQSGGFTAEFGGATSGIIRSSMRSGGSQFKVSLDYLTDDFAKSGKEFLGTTARGYKNAVVTLSGPVMTGVRFFFANQYNYARNGSARFIEPFMFDNLTQDALGAPRKLGEVLPGPVQMLRNGSVNQNWNWNNTAQGNLHFDMAELANLPMKIRVSGNYANANSINSGNWPNLVNVFIKPERLSRNDASTAFGNLRLTHFLSKNTFYEIGLSYTRQWGRTYDKVFGDDWIKYPDSVANAQAGFVGYNGYGWSSRYVGPPQMTSIFQFRFNDPDAPNNSYSKYNQTQMAVTVDLTSQITSRWELKAGGNIENWLYRTFSFGNISGYLRWIDSNEDGIISDDAVIYATDIAKGKTIEMAKRARIIARGGVGSWGYDYMGNETDGYTLPGSNAVWDKPYKPTFASAYVQNKIEYQDLVLNFGVRYEYSLTDVKEIPQTVNPITGQLDYVNPDGLDQTLNIIDAGTFTRTKANHLILPRISFSFPVTDRTIFYAQYGKYAQMPSLGQLYRSDNSFQSIVNPNARSVYGGSAPWLVQPERTTQFEVGFRQYLTDNLAFSLNGFYKDTKNLITLRKVYDTQGIPTFTGYQNEDFATSKGIELTLELRRTNRLSAKVNYTLSDARGTGNASGSNAVVVSDETRARAPNFTAPLSYNQTHRGNLVLDYRYAKGEGGPILEGMGVYALMSFNSGHNYTKIQEPSALGQASAWNVGSRALLDARNRYPVEPANASTTPWVFNIDLNWNKAFYFDGLNFELYVNVLNVLNTKQVLNVYPTTGTPSDDGWLKSPNASSYKAIPYYEAFYRAINLDNRWTILQSFVGDVYGAPRQIRVGARLEF